MSSMLNLHSITVRLLPLVLLGIGLVTTAAGQTIKQSSMSHQERKISPIVVFSRKATQKPRSTVPQPPSRVNKLSQAEIRKMLSNDKSNIPRKMDAQLSNYLTLSIQQPFVEGKGFLTIIPTAFVLAGQNLAMLDGGSKGASIWIDFLPEAPAASYLVICYVQSGISNNDIKLTLFFGDLSQEITVPGGESYPVSMFIKTDEVKLRRIELNSSGEWWFHSCDFKRF